MIVFSLQRNKLWSGSGFLIKPGVIEFSSMCFAEQTISLGTGRYNVKMVGSAVSGNGVCYLQICCGQSEILSKSIIFNGKANTEVLLNFDLYSPGQYKIKLSRGKDSIGRMSVSLFNFSKIIEKKEITPVVINKQKNDYSERTFVVLDYDNLNSPSEISSIFLDLKNYVGCFFLLKSTDINCFDVNNSNFKLFFEWDDIFDYLSLYDSKRIVSMEENSEIFKKYNSKIDVILQKPKDKSILNEISGMIF